MKKTLALVLALAMVFSTITVAFAEGTLSADAQICADLGMLKGSTGTVDAAYTATAPTRIQAAVMFLRLKGLEADAMAFTGTANFADADKAAWAKPIMAYLKANPQLGWQGDGTNFDPAGLTTAQAYYKVMLETLGYKQTTAEVVGDFAYADVVTFAASKGLTKVAAVTNFTVNDLATATVEALKANMKDGGKTLVATLIEAGKVDNAKAVAAGLVTAAPTKVATAIDEVSAIGNTVVQVVFEDDVDAAAAGNAANYSIEGLEIKNVVVAGSDTVRLETAAQTAGKLYTLTSGDQSVKFSGLAKVSDGPTINGVTAEDVEEVIVSFDRNLDFASATDVATWEIKGITVVKAEFDSDEPDEVILTTEGLKDGEDYTVKAMNIKSIDLVNRKTTTDDFDADYDVSAPKISDAYADTNERIIVKFNEDVTEESAEDLANYAVKVDETDGAALDIISIEWDDDTVEITTEPMEENEDYKITISNIADQRKVANVMTKSYSKTFDAVDVDDKAPDTLSSGDITVLSPTKFMVTFHDESRLDKESVLDEGNYELENDGNTLDIENIEEYDSDTTYFKAIFTVEEMAVEDTELTYVDILDEFGNAMEEKTVDVNFDEDNFASAYLLSNSADPNRVQATGENTIVLTFVGKLNEDSAENIANYTIDGGIGTPTKAEYEYKVSGATQYDKVRLTVNDLIAGHDYDLTIKGLFDLAGNELEMDDITINTTLATNWDTEVKLKDADTASKYVVALSFGEEVEYDPAAHASYVVLSEADDSSVSPVTLYAHAMADNDETVEFSDYGTSALKTDVTYYVYDLAGVTNLRGATATFTVGDQSVKASANDEPEYAEFKSLDQIDADTVKVVMSRNVMAPDTTVDGWTIEVDGNADEIDETVYFRRSMTAATDYTLELWKYLTDEHGIPAVDDDDVVYNDTDNGAAITDLDYLEPVDGVTAFESDKADTTAPEIDDVTVYDRMYIEVAFDENLANVDASDIEIVNLDKDEDPISIASVAISGHENASNDDYEGAVLEITLNEALQAGCEYELRLADGAVTDYAGKDSTEDTFSFDGTNKAQHGDL